MTASDFEKQVMMKLKEGYVKDLQKPEIDKFERAAIIRSILNDKGISVRQMAREYNIPRSTIEDWLMYERISEAEYNSLVKKGVKPLQIYRGLREAKTEEPITNQLDLYLVEVKRRLRASKPHDASERTKVLLDEVVDAANALHSNIIVMEKRQR